LQNAALVNENPTNFLLRYGSASILLGKTEMLSKPIFLAVFLFAFAAVFHPGLIHASPVALPQEPMTAQLLFCPIALPNPVAAENEPCPSIFAAEKLAAAEIPHTNRLPAENADLQSSIDAAVTAQTLYKMPRKRLADFAMKLTDIRYRRGGHEPSTGFDCSGFVHYVFDKTFGLELPFDAPSQFLDGEKIARDQMKTGDLVFFHEGKRITHVGIYLGNERFIHSPSPGKRVRVDRLDSTYWVKRFAGAKRPDVLS
jgi:hypothetical protein